MRKFSSLTLTDPNNRNNNYFSFFGRYFKHFRDMSLLPPHSNTNTHHALVNRVCDEGKKKKKKQKSVYDSYMDLWVGNFLKCLVKLYRYIWLSFTSIIIERAEKKTPRVVPPIKSYKIISSRKKRRKIYGKAGARKKNKKCLFYEYYAPHENIHNWK